MTRLRPFPNRRTGVSPVAYSDNADAPLGNAVHGRDGRATIKVTAEIGLAVRIVKSLVRDAPLALG
jgi:hypothetical protein